MFYSSKSDIFLFKTQLSSDANTVVSEGCDLEQPVSFLCLPHLGNGMCILGAAFVSSEIASSSGILFLPECPPWKMTGLTTIQDVEIVLTQSQLG